MKKHISFLVVILFFVACSKPSDDDSPKVKQNTPPSIPTLVYPTNNLICIDNTVTFQWSNSIDAEEDLITYHLQVSKDNQFSQIVFSSNISTNEHTITLQKGTTYYWKVKAKDNKNLSSNFSPTYLLYTEQDGSPNHLPHAPELVSPTNNTFIDWGNTTLEWTANDIDGDTLSYDVYLDTSNPPTTLISEEQSESTLTISTTTTTGYYWKVIVKDGNGGESVGQVWSFNTN